MHKLSQTEYGYTTSGTLANGSLYADVAGRVYFLTDDEAHQLNTISKKTAPVPGSFSCHVKVESVESNIGGEGSTATLKFDQSDGIDIRPGSMLTDSIPIQITADVEELVKRGAIIKFTLSAIEETP